MVRIKRLALQIRTLIASYFACRAHKNKAAGEWLCENFSPSSYGYEMGEVRLALGELYNELFLAINPGEDLVMEGKWILRRE